MPDFFLHKGADLVNVKNLCNVASNLLVLSCGQIRLMTYLSVSLSLVGRSSCSSAEKLQLPNLSVQFWESKGKYFVSSVGCPHDFNFDFHTFCSRNKQVISHQNFDQVLVLR